MKYYICITPFFPSEDSFRGPFVYDQVKAIERNSELKVLVFKPASFLHKEGDYEFEGVKVYRNLDYTLPSNIFPNKISDKLSYKSFRKKLQELNIDPNDIVAIHAHTTNLASYAINLKRDFPHIKSLIQHHGFDVMGETNGRLANSNWHKKLCKKYGARLCNEADLNVGVSRKTLEYVKVVEGVKLKNEYVLYNGVDTTKFYPKPSNSEAHQQRSVLAAKRTNNQFTIGCVGNFWELKDQITLIKAVEKVIHSHPYASHEEEIRVRFVGTGYTRENCESYIKEHGIDKYFEFIDSIPHNQLPDFYRSLDLFVLPSYWEAFGCVYTEAYACGVPFIGVKGQGISEIIEVSEKDKWLIAKGDWGSLAHLIMKTMKNPNLCQKLSNQIDIDNLIISFLDHLDKNE